MQTVFSYKGGLQTAVLQRWADGYSCSDLWFVSIAPMTNRISTHQYLILKDVLKHMMLRIQFPKKPRVCQLFPLFGSISSWRNSFHRIKALRQLVAALCTHGRPSQFCNEWYISQKCFTTRKRFLAWDVCMGRNFSNASLMQSSRCLAADAFTFNFGELFALPLIMLIVILFTGCFAWFSCLLAVLISWRT